MLIDLCSMTSLFSVHVHFIVVFRCSWLHTILICVYIVIYVLCVRMRTGVCVRVCLSVFVFSLVLMLVRV
jgi:hypothetical protein